MAENEILEEKHIRQLSAGETSAEIVSAAVIQNMVHVIHDQQVMLDSDLAKLYQVETSRLNEAAKRNIERFPEAFRFQLTHDENLNLISQFAISSSKDNYGGRRKLPYVYTEQGIAMLSAVLRSSVAIQVSINIMNAFVEMRRYMASTISIQERLAGIETSQRIYQQQTDEKFEQVFNYISTHSESEQKIFFEGQIYDAFQVLTNIVAQANHSIILIDDYVDVKTLNILKEKKSGVSVDIWTYPNTRLSSMDVATFNAQYPQVTIHYANTFHDRFLVIDDETAYMVGASLKDAGKKCFAITKVCDELLIHALIEHLNSI